MFPNNSGVLFFGAEGQAPVAWDAIPETVMDEENAAEEQSKVFATMRDNPTVTFGCHIRKQDIRNLMEAFRPFKLAKGPYRKRMIRRAKKMQTNYIYNCTYTFRKEGDEYVDKRGQVRLVLQ